MDAEFINPFLSSVLNVLSTMATIDAKPGTPAVKKDQTAQGDITGIIGMAGKQARGTLAISFPDKVLYEITKRMIGEESGVNIDDYTADTAGEITNMVTGGAKRILSEKGYEFAMALPTVVSGKGHVVRHKPKVPVIIIPFETYAGSFFIEICFEKPNGS